MSSSKGTGAPQGPNASTSRPFSAPPALPAGRTFYGDAHRDTTHNSSRVNPGRTRPPDSHNGAYAQRSKYRKEGQFVRYMARSRSTLGAKATRWSFVLQDIPSSVRQLFHDVNKGYAARVTCAMGAGLALSYALYYRVMVHGQADKPLAQRWMCVSPKVPIVFIERRDEEGSRMCVYRFALPNSYDYTGYDAVSSVRMHSCNSTFFARSSLSRWYTPISHPRTRGFIEFAIKDCDPGRMSARLRALKPGEVMYLGRWMREFRYTANTHRELSMLCSTAGASVALQLMRVVCHNPHDHTRLRLLYCHRTATDIPFKQSYFDEYVRQYPERVDVRYNVLVRPSSSSSASASLPSTGKNVNEARERRTADGGDSLYYYGMLDYAILQAALSPPVIRLQPNTSGGAASDFSINSDNCTATSNSSWTNVSSSWLRWLSSSSTMVRPPILVCGPQTMLSNLCGRVSPLGNATYWQGPFYKYGGLMKDVGYTRGQVYKFGVSTSVLANR